MHGFDKEGELRKDLGKRILKNQEKREWLERW